MKKVIALVILIAASAAGIHAQAIDQDKMKRDIEIAENILATLMYHQDGENTLSFFGRSPFNGTYVSGYGVVFGAPKGLPHIYLANRKYVDVIRHSERRERGAVVLETPDRKVEFLNVDSLEAVASREWVEDAQTFLVDYAHLISQLQPENKIMITNGPSGFGEKQFFLRDRGNRMSLEVTKKDLDAFHSGKISKDQLVKLIRVTTNEKGTIEKDIQLMANIFETLYKQDLSETYYVSGNVFAERIKDLGAILQMKVYSSISESEGLHRIVTQDIRGLSQKERDEKVKVMYPKFMEDLKKNMVHYGRTIKSLKENEQLILNVYLTRCEGCDIPDSVELSVKASDLLAFDQGKISEAEAIKAIQVNEVGNQ